MTASTPVDNVAEILTAVGYRRLKTPLEIAGLKFEVNAAFIGAAKAPDLILVADTAFEEEVRILKTVEGITRAMDVMESTRPVTTILAGPRPSSSVLIAMSRVCRVLPIGMVLDEDSGATLRNWLAVLMPLNLPEPEISIAKPLKELAGQVDGLHPDIAALLNLAELGADAVEERLHEIISQPLEIKDEDGAP